MEKERSFSVPFYESISENPPELMEVGKGIYLDQRLIISIAAKPKSDSVFNPENKVIIKTANHGQYDLIFESYSQALEKANYLTEKVNEKRRGTVANNVKGE